MNARPLKSARVALYAAPALLLAGCGATGDDQPVHAITTDEAQALNDAASMLDGNALPPENTIEPASNAED